MTASFHALWILSGSADAFLLPRGRKCDVLASLKLPDPLVSNLATTVTMMCVSLACDNGESRRRQGPGLRRACTNSGTDQILGPYQKMWYLWAVVFVLGVEALPKPGRVYHTISWGVTGVSQQRHFSVCRTRL